MYLHIGLNYMLKKTDIVGIFDIEKTTGSWVTKQFLAKAQKGGRIVNVTMELPRSFIVSKYKDRERVYLTSLSAQTLIRRNSEKREEFILNYNDVEEIIS